MVSSEDVVSTVPAGDGEVASVVESDRPCISHACPCASKYTCQCECQCARCQEQRENPKPLPQMIPVPQEMKDWIKAEADKWKAEKKDGYG